MSESRLGVLPAFLSQTAMNSPLPYPNVLQLRCSRNPFSSPRTRTETITLRTLRHLIYVEDSPEYHSLSLLNPAYRALFDSYTTAHEHVWFMRKTKDAGRLVSTIDYVINLAVKHQGLIQKISLSLGELVEDETAIFSDSLAKECSAFAETTDADVIRLLTEVRKMFEDFERRGLLDQMASHSAYILIVGVLGTYLLSQVHSEPWNLWLVLTALAYVLFMSVRLLGRLKREAATVSRALYMFVAARMELAGWIGSLAELRGTADCRSEISVATNNIAKFRVIVCYARLILHDSSIICVSSSMMDSKTCSTLATFLATTTEYGTNYLPILCPLPDRRLTRSRTPTILRAYQQAVTLLPSQPTLEVSRSPRMTMP
ncbi:hypothetical protein ARMGADRAFT_575917 [Armillaria gallica]|uniref:Uncharacterized protein n=1 Tax=Armillaria gallica TaxID=47427 RepID=A0A2H3E5K4_ARMGA|nr:hypothetical protein ARMGADRAFT_575917 [Armillaria gallica]